MIYYQNRYLAKHLGLNLAKWKRWSREFLPPDPLGGRQTGFARQFSLKDAFRVYLAGFLVSELKFSIPETRQVLSDLSGWLKEKGFDKLQIHPQEFPSPSENGDAPWLIFIYSPLGRGFTYAFRQLRHTESMTEKSMCSETFSRTLLPAGDTDPFVDGRAVGVRVLAITALYHEFVQRISSGITAAVR